jgi:hypothetical protein
MRSANGVECTPEERMGSWPIALFGEGGTVEDHTRSTAPQPRLAPAPQLR